MFKRIETFENMSSFCHRIEKTKLEKPKFFGFIGWNENWSFEKLKINSLSGRAGLLLAQEEMGCTTWSVLDEYINTLEWHLLQFTSLCCCYCMAARCLQTPLLEKTLANGQIKDDFQSKVELFKAESLRWIFCKDSVMLGIMAFFNAMMLC